MTRDMSRAVEQITARLLELERELEHLEPLVTERDRLLRARAALLGEAAPNVATWRPRITREDVADYLAKHPGSRAGQIAAALGAGQAAVSAHLYRGKGDRFVNRDGRWYVSVAS
jgi:hypothetical protein